MMVLVAYASRHGATAGIAERIAAGLREAGITAEARSVSDVRAITGYDAFVVGGAAYMYHWMKEATDFVKRHRAILVKRPVWLFSSGPIGTDLVDEKGRDIFEVTRPKEFPELVAQLHPRGERVFFGAWDPKAPPVGLAERFMRHMPAFPGMPIGDFRDWPAIDAWAAEIAAELAAELGAGNAAPSREPSLVGAAH
jgi:menaquinone-dependent protoporphyrinogen oxidase